MNMELCITNLQAYEEAPNLGLAVIFYVDDANLGTLLLVNKKN